MSPPQAAAACFDVCQLEKDRPQVDAILALAVGPLGTFRRTSPQALTSHEDVLGQWEAVGFAELPALQVDQKGAGARPVDHRLHLPMDGGQEAVLIKVLVPAVLRVLDGGDGELWREQRLALTPPHLLAQGRRRASYTSPPGPP